jgi:hypothetical protein
VSPRVAPPKPNQLAVIPPGGLPDAQQRAALLAFLRARVKSQKL